AKQISDQSRQSIRLIFCRAEFDRDVLTLDIVGFLQAPAESGHKMRHVNERCTAEKPDHRHRRLLRARRERPGGRATEQRDELAPFHSITSSAMASTPDGMSRPSVWAVAIAIS